MLCKLFTNCLTYLIFGLVLTGDVGFKWRMPPISDGNTPEMELGHRVVGHRVGDFGWVWSGHGSVCQTQFSVLTCAFIVALSLQSSTVSANR